VLDQSGSPHGRIKAESRRKKKSGDKIYSSKACPQWPLSTSLLVSNLFSYEIVNGLIH
jgi:hypothetical protein